MHTYGRVSVSNSPIQSAPEGSSTHTETGQVGSIAVDGFGTRVGEATPATLLDVKGRP
jgi:hypothetical protein